MMAMQYSLTLPADYDMSIIDRRIRDKGPLLDGYPNLLFKAYLRAAKGDLGSRDNLYAPFYLWEGAEGASSFLCGPGFQAIIRDFGRPSVNTWIVWSAAIGPDVKAAKFATREIMPIGSHEALDGTQKSESNVAQHELNGAALASVTGFEPTTWSRVRCRLWSAPPVIDPAAGTQVYRVGHVSTGL
ncbi:DUF4865 family protein [Microvirga rosea]|uniref:DUF4865 family protein n=1 Tax=Microvirga rosea TaxID=2715425 RepID=UPI001D0B357C|nr:DUF4865 family protein [Microvirga rosea]MCB8821253.1 DUF4865 family protein [Microvirga rosea]